MLNPAINRLLEAVPRWSNRPLVILGSVAIALLLGASGLPIVVALRPLGSLYVALLQMCVLPFLLATIPLAVRSAIVGSTNAAIVGALVGWVICAVLIVGTIGVIVPTIVFDFSPFDPSNMRAIGALIGGSVGQADFAFSLDGRDALSPTVGETGSGMLALVPSNIFSALSADDTTRVLIFAAVFGVAMTLTERSSGRSMFGALQSLHDACLLIFGWLNSLVPIGIVALIAPQIALMGPRVYVVLAQFCYAFAITSTLLLSACVVVLSTALNLRLRATFGYLIKPLMVAAGTRNTLACIPVSVQTMTRELNASRAACELYIPIGFATLRFGTMVHYTTAALFVGALLGRSFGLTDIIMVAVLSVASSFATLGLSGAAALAPLVGVLQPFGLPYELAFPLLVIVDPVAHMLRIMLNVAVNCTIPGLAARSALQETVSV